jgi:hypothetical protein
MGSVLVRTDVQIRFKAEKSETGKQESSRTVKAE